jgi:hypothetical protein
MRSVILESARRRLRLLALLWATCAATIGAGFSGVLGVQGLVAGFAAVACFLPLTGALWRAWRGWRRAIEALIDDDDPLFI